MAIKYTGPVFSEGIGFLGQTGGPTLPPFPPTPFIPNPPRPKPPAPTGAGPGYADMPMGTQTLGPREFFGTGTPELPPGYTPYDVTDLGAAGEAQCNRLANPLARAACKMAVAAATNAVGNRGGGSSTQLTTTCPQGYKRAADGSCQLEGVAPYIPGDVGQQDTGWTPVNGRYGIGATPIRVQRVVRACPPGFVLGNDGICYDSLPRTKRAHNPGARPLLSGGDMNALRKAHALQKTIGKIYRQHGKKPASRIPAHGHRVTSTRRKK